MDKKLKITLVKSSIGRPEKQRKVLRGVRIQLDALDGDIHIAIPGAFGARDLARSAAFRAFTFHKVSGVGVLLGC